MQSIRPFLWSLVTLVVVAAVPASAENPSPTPSALDPALIPFVTAGTLLAAKVDLTRIDPAAIHDGLLAAAQADLAPEQAQRAVQLLEMHDNAAAQRWLADFRKAGANIVYAVAFLGDPQDLPGVVIVPLSPTADARAIAGLLVSGDASGPDKTTDPDAGREAISLNGAIVYGLTVQVEKMKLARPVHRPLLADAFASLGDAPIQIVFSPSLVLQLVAGEMLPDRLPDAAGGAMPADLMHSLTWAALGASPPPDPFVHLLIQCTDADGAQAYAGALNALLTTLANNPDRCKLMPKMTQLVAALRPSLSGDLLTLNLDSTTLDRLIVPQAMLEFYSTSLANAEQLKSHAKPSSAPAAPAN